MIRFVIDNIADFRKKIESLTWAKIKGGTAYIFICQSSGGVVFAMSDLDERYATFFMPYVNHEIKDVRMTYVLYHDIIKALSQNSDSVEFEFEVKSLPKEFLRFESERNEILQEAEMSISKYQLCKLIEDMQSPLYLDSTDSKPFKDFVCLDPKRHYYVYCNGRILLANTLSHHMTKENEEIHAHISLFDYAKQFVEEKETFEFKFTKAREYREGHGLCYYLTCMAFDDFMIIYRSPFNMYPPYTKILDRFEESNQILNTSQAKLIKMIDMLPLDPQVDESRDYYKTSHAVNFNIAAGRMYTESDLPEITRKFFNIETLLTRRNTEIFTNGMPFSINYLKFILDGSENIIEFRFLGDKDPMLFKDANDGMRAIMPIDKNKHYALKPEETPF